jgi:hypothetical protein
LSDEPYPEDIYQQLCTALETSEKKISGVLFKHLKEKKLATNADFFGFGIGRRTLAMSSGFRLMVEQKNSLCALPMVRMQLDSVLRLYAGFWVEDHREFCSNVLSGVQIDRMKDREGNLMRDKALVDKLATKNPWITNVYKVTSGYVHFSNRHIMEVFKKGDDGTAQIAIGPRGSCPCWWCRRPLICLP